MQAAGDISPYKQHNIYYVVSSKGGMKWLPITGRKWENDWAAVDGKWGEESERMDGIIVTLKMADVECLLRP